MKNLKLILAMLVVSSMLTTFTARAEENLENTPGYQIAEASDSLGVPMLGDILRATVNTHTNAAATFRCNVVSGELAILYTSITDSVDLSEHPEAGHWLGASGDRYVGPSDPAGNRVRRTALNRLCRRGPDGYFLPEHYAQLIGRLYEDNLRKLDLVFVNNVIQATGGR